MQAICRLAAKCTASLLTPVQGWALLLLSTWFLYITVRRAPYHRQVPCNGTTGCRCSLGVPAWVAGMSVVDAVDTSTCPPTPLTSAPPPPLPLQHLPERGRGRLVLHLLVGLWPGAHRRLPSGEMYLHASADAYRGWPGSASRGRRCSAKGPHSQLAASALLNGSTFRPACRSCSTGPS